MEVCEIDYWKDALTSGDGLILTSDNQKFQFEKQQNEERRLEDWNAE